MGTQVAWAGGARGTVYPEAAGPQDRPWEPLSEESCLPPAPLHGPPRVNLPAASSPSGPVPMAFSPSNPRTKPSEVWESQEPLAKYHTFAAFIGSCTVFSFPPILFQRRPESCSLGVSLSPQYSFPWGGRGGFARLRPEKCETWGPQHRPHEPVTLWTFVIESDTGLAHRWPAHRGRWETRGKD